jgi:ketosteroid isomerase-like protein
MKIASLAAFAALFIVGQIARADESASKEIEKALTVLNDAFVKKDVDAIKKLMTDDHVSITPYYDGALTGAQQIAALKDFKDYEYTTGKMKFTSIDKDTVLVTYPLTMKGSFKGKPLAAKSYVSSLWTKRDGKWVEALYQETALGEK